LQSLQPPQLAPQPAFATDVQPEASPGGATGAPTQTEDARGTNSSSTAGHSGSAQIIGDDQDDRLAFSTVFDFAAMLRNGSATADGLRALFGRRLRRCVAA
jgi:hypothetical protein